MSLLDFYKSTEKISRIGYQIDHVKNILILDFFEKVAKTLNDNCIPFVTTGSLGATFYSKKCYRTFEDIDIMIENKDLLKTLYLLKDSFNIHLPIEQSSTEVLKHFQMGHNIESSRNPIILESILTKVKLEIFIYNYEHYRKVYILNLNKISYCYTMPSKIIDNNYWNRQKDMDDIEVHMLKKNLQLVI